MHEQVFERLNGNKHGLKQDVLLEIFFFDLLEMFGLHRANTDI